MKHRSLILFVLRLSSFVALVLPALACNTLFPPRPPVEWNNVPDNVVIQASSGGGMVYEPNPMPVARLWGDGRLIWAVGGYTSSRRVQIATLTPDQVRQLLQTFVDDGFFGWKDSYSPGVVYDAPSTCITVSLSSVTKTVCETLSGAPARFHDLLDRLASGAGAPGTDYVPDRGYLVVKPVGKALLPGGGLVVAWPGAKLGLRLADVGEGKWIVGEALRLAWGAVNANPMNPILQDGDVYYQAQLLVANVTAMEPPN
jgi:hypothetical protein